MSDSLRPHEPQHTRPPCASPTPGVHPNPCPLYKREDGKNRLSYVRTVFRFNCDSRKRLFNTEFTAIAEMVVTNRYAGEAVEPIDRKEAFRSSETRADKTQAYFDPDFWKAYNIIEPTESLENAIDRLKKAESK